MGFVGSEPSQASVSSAGILDGAIVDADINASAAIAISKTAFSAGTGVTLSTNTLNVDAAQTGITSLLATDIKIGEDNETKIDFEDANTINFYANNAKEVVLAENSISPGTNNGTALGTTSLMWSDLFLADGGVINLNNGDVILTHSSNLVTLTGGGLVVGVDDTGHDVKFFGASAGAYMEWDESADQLRIMGASADATTSTGKLLLATSLTDINANDVIGKVEFQAPHEAGGTDAITVAAGIEAVAQGTFSASVNSTDLIFKTGHSEAATEKFRFTSQGEIGIGGANYGTDGQLLTSGGAGAAPAWEDAPAGGSSFTATAEGAISAAALVALKSDGKIETCEALQSGVAFGSASSPNGEEIEADNTYYLACAFEPDTNKLAVGYRDAGNSNYPTIAIGDIDNASTGALSFGTPTVCESSAGNYNANSIVYDTNVDRFLYVYTTANGIRSVTFCVNNTSTHTITQGSAQGIDNSQRSSIAVFDSANNKVIIIFEDADNSDHLYMKGVTVRGSTDNDVASFTSNTALHAYDCGVNNGPASACFDDNDGKTVVVFRDTNNSNYPTAVAVTYNSGGNDFTIGTKVALSNVAMSTLEGGITIHDPDKNINLHYNSASANYELDVEFLPFTSASGSITAGTRSTHNRSEVESGWELGRYVAGHYDPDNDKFVFFNGYKGIVAFVGTLSGTGSGAEFSVSSTTKLHDKNGTDTGGYVEYLCSTYDTNDNKSLIFYKSTTGDTGVFGLMPTLPKNATSFIGFANDAISDGATGTVTTSGGVATGQSSLTIGSHYYVSSAGTLTTTSGTVHAGKALTATTLLVNAPHV